MTVSIDPTSVEDPGPSPGSEGYDAWVAGWVEVIRQSPLSTTLIEFPSTRILALSEAASELLGVTADQIGVVDAFAVLEQPEGEVELVAQALTVGALDAAYSRHLVRRPDGSVVQVVATGRMMRGMNGPDIGVWAIAACSPATQPPPEVTGPAVADPGPPSRVSGTLDHTWRLDGLSDATRSIGWARPADLLGTSILDHVHPADILSLVLGLADATAFGDADIDIRLRGDSLNWIRVHGSVAVLRDGGRQPRFEFVLSPVPATPSETGPAEIDDAWRFRNSPPRTVPGLADTTGGLSARQWEVLARLRSGQRVPTIAREMYLSPSTVRNHLAAIFRKAAVHSQDELLALLRDGRQIF